MVIDKTKEFAIERLTTGPKHHLFGFHDLYISNRLGDKYLAIESIDINRPPLPDEKFGFGFVQDGHFVKVGETSAFNYPQGARQQWVSDTDFFVVNNRVGDHWGTDLYDSKTARLIDRFDVPTHVLTADGRYSLGLDYARLHRLGGYGYAGIPDCGASDPLPSNSGITIIDLNTKEKKLLVSVLQVASCGTSNLSGRAHHYLSHLCLNPTSTRVAFLHRYFLPDGGLMTRLMTIGIDGSNLRCLGQGFLSHFAWKDDCSLYIYGRVGSPIDSIRNNPFLGNPLIMHSLRLAKKVVRKVIGNNRTIVNSMSFVMITDSERPEISGFAKETINSDGHPMTHPANDDWCICDTYPDEIGDRSLFLYQFSKDLRMNIGTFRRLFDNPDMTLKEQFLGGIDKNIRQLISESQLAFTRSGLHCDLHPRWSNDGNWAVFDSIHEGTRQIYRVNVSDTIR